MTTVTYRDGVMAADSRAYAGDKLPIGSKHKLRKLPDGTLVGVSTTVAGFGESLHKWIADGRVFADAPKVFGEPSFELLLVDPDGQVFYANDNFHFTGPLEAQFFAIGSGSQYALGALHHGADAIAAAECGAALDVWSDFPIRSITLKD